MKKSFFVLLFLFFNLVSSTQFSPSQKKDVEVNVIGPPILIIDSPLNNGIYFSNNSLYLLLRENGKSVWYNLDNGNNITIAGLTKIYAGNGVHKLRIFANNSFGKSKANVSFEVNLSLYKIIYKKFNDSTTDFDRFNFKEIQNLEVILEIKSIGKITFGNKINVTADSNDMDALTDIDSAIKISSGKVSVDSSLLPNFNKPAFIEMYGLTVNKPQIFKDGLVCSDCQILNYSGGNLNFTVSNFSGEYVVEETISPINNGKDFKGGGSDSLIGGGEFNISLEGILKLSINQGGLYRQTIDLVNTGSKNSKFKISISGLDNFTIIGEDSFSLNSKEHKKIKIDFFSKENTPPDTYLGKIIIKSETISKEIDVILEVVEINPLFDLSTNIIGDSKVLIGQTIKVRFNILNLGELRNIDILMHYEIRDFGGHIISSKEESIGIEKKLSIERYLKIPENISEGNYVIYSKVSFGNISASSSQGFEIVKELPKNAIKKYVLIFFLVLLLGYILLKDKFVHKRKKKN